MDVDAASAEVDQPSTQPIHTDPTVVELYKLAVEMADRVSARRTAANNFFLSLHAAVTTAVGVLGIRLIAIDGALSKEVVPTLVTGAAGLALCIAWWLGLRSYRDLNRAKFKVITSLEPLLPIQIFGDEWKFLRGDAVHRWRGRYAEQGTVERTVPFIFGAIYALAICAVLIR